MTPLERNRMAKTLTTVTKISEMAGTGTGPTSRIINARDNGNGTVGMRVKIAFCRLTGADFEDAWGDGTPGRLIREGKAALGQA